MRYKKRGRRVMEPSIITALAAAGGSIVGGAATVDYYLDQPAYPDSPRARPRRDFVSGRGCTASSSPKHRAWPLMRSLIR